MFPKANARHAFRRLAYATYVSFSAFCDVSRTVFEAASQRELKKKGGGRGGIGESRGSASKFASFVAFCGNLK